MEKEADKQKEDLPKAVQTHEAGREGEAPLGEGQFARDITIALRNPKAESGQRFQDIVERASRQDSTRRSIGGLKQRIQKILGRVKGENDKDSLHR